MHYLILAITIFFFFVDLFGGKILLCFLVESNLPMVGMFLRLAEGLFAFLAIILFFKGVALSIAHLPFNPARDGKNFSGPRPTLCRRRTARLSSACIGLFHVAASVSLSLLLWTYAGNSPARADNLGVNVTRYALLPLFCVLSVSWGVLLYRCEEKTGSLLLFLGNHLRNGRASPAANCARPPWQTQLKAVIAILSLGCFFCFDAIAVLSITFFLKQTGLESSRLLAGALLLLLTALAGLVHDGGMLAHSLAPNHRTQQPFSALRRCSKRFGLLKISFCFVHAATRCAIYGFPIYWGLPLPTRAGLKFVAPAPFGCLTAVVLIAVCIAVSVAWEVTLCVAEKRSRFPKTILDNLK